MDNDLEKVTGTDRKKNDKMKHTRDLNTELRERDLGRDLGI